MDKPTNAGKAQKPANSRRILLLDDELAVRQALARLIKALGHECTAVSIGEEILAEIESTRHNNTPYDVAILDIKIANGMGAIETMLEMRQLGSTLPVISMSGYSSDEILIDQAARAEFSGHLQKPFSKDDLISQIERASPVLISEANPRPV